MHVKPNHKLPQVDLIPSQSVAAEGNSSPFNEAGNGAAVGFPVCHHDMCNLSTFMCSPLL